METRKIVATVFDRDLPQLAGTAAIILILALSQ